MFSESARALAAVGGDATRVVPWLDTGRFPHDGDPMSAADLRKLMESAHQVRIIASKPLCAFREFWGVVS